MAQGKKKSSKKSQNPFSSLRNTFAEPKYGQRQFKRDVKKLVKAGLYTPKVNLPDIEPGRYINSLLKKFRGVLEGTQTTYAINPGERKKLQEAHIPVRNGHAIINVPKGAKAKRLPARNGIPRFEVTERHKNGNVRRFQREVVIGGDVIAQIQWHIDEAPELRKGEYYGLRFNGGLSAALHSSKRSLAEYVMKYDAVQWAEQDGSPEAAAEVVQFIEVQIWKPGPHNKEYNRERDMKALERRREARARKVEEFMSEFRLTRQEANAYLNRRKDQTKRAEYDRQRRANMTDEQKAEYRRKARIRKARNR